ncbi:MAG: 30S ribosomal protein S4e [Candidatus Nanohaloarchaeota archaeon QJJ-9]|nr:30S ribosomal protein S4e [Candidatus Nanohaloarchaeota archaeon QJJ-9]
MAHQKRLSAPKHYPVARKEEPYVAKGKGPKAEEAGVPLVLLLREILELADSKSEANNILEEGNVKVNGNIQKDTNFTIGFMDIISLDKVDKDYRVLIDKEGLVFKEVDDPDSRLFRVEDKTTVKGGKTQLNLDAGVNLLTDEEYDTKGSLVVNIGDMSVEKNIPLEKGYKAFITGGKHVGEVAEIKEHEVVKGPQENLVKLESDDKEFETVEEFIFVVGKDEPEVMV